jgi:hypothetical protein
MDDLVKESVELLDTNYPVARRAADAVQKLAAIEAIRTSYKEWVLFELAVDAQVLDFGSIGITQTEILTGLASKYRVEPRKYIQFCRRSFNQARKGLGLRRKQVQRHTASRLGKVIRNLAESSKMLREEGLARYCEALDGIKADVERHREEVIKSKKERSKKRVAMTITRWSAPIDKRSASYFSGELSHAIECNPRIKKLIRPEGKKLDELAAEAAAEGIIPEPDISMFIEALAEDRKLPEAQNEDGATLCERRHRERQLLEYEEEVKKLM